MSKEGITPAEWSEVEAERFDILVRKEVLGELGLKEAVELEVLARKREELIVRVPMEDVNKERLRREVLAELERVVKKETEKTKGVKLEK